MGVFDWLFGGGSDESNSKSDSDYHESGNNGKPVYSKTNVYSPDDENGRHEHVFSKTYQENGVIKHEEGFAGKEAVRTRENKGK